MRVIPAEAVWSAQRRGTKGWWVGMAGWDGIWLRHVARGYSPAEEDGEEDVDLRG